MTMVTPATHGLSDAALAYLESRWRGGWDERFETIAPGCD